GQNTNSAAGTTVGFPSTAPVVNSKPSTLSVAAGTPAGANNSLKPVNPPVTPTVASAPANSAPTLPTSGRIGQPDSQQAAAPAAQPPAPAEAASPKIDTVTEQAEKTEPTTATTENRSADQGAGPASVGNLDLRTAFRVKYVADGAAYLDGGST